MKKWVIILLIIALSSGLYLYYNNNWQQKLEQLAQFKAEMDQPLTVEEEVTVQLNETTTKQKKKIRVISPFISELKLNEEQENIANEEKKSGTESQKNKEKMQAKNPRPFFKLLGILKNNNRSLVSIAVGKEIKRLTVGEEIKGFKLVEINENNVVLKKAEQRFTFWLGGEEKKKKQ
ncbi:hypothetical protein [Halanaerobacter jeridensis]|uniref:Uncharacterized protein n=1 Tax=Halanaerobacter jeridensis TaxID=706427 RepID=A0A938XN24_9FIRM|nr:hypothetical protein [Halanaerobacter jeridensis]MBM7555298.1 hypothetical protein [Halanaerobacter jeridensis]